MAKMLRIEEMIEALEAVDGDARDNFERRLIELADEIANHTATRLDVDTSGSSFGVHSEGGTLTPFMPKYPGQAIPAALAELDPEGEWLTNAETAKAFAECSNGIPDCPGPAHSESELICDECFEE